ncbi:MULTISPECIES: 4Fe-4S dicluster domain-containing protein [unclassified Candidatus Frackibacter]|uniref:4Fe-4S dicluster domain-containing protein n=1 Tax=unclassified Candidatus Frackibacter TaxID=2648818 RepID=UPI00088F055E|nr:MULTISPECIES: 4Fe-4S dicluster domain-containing protein [unclassified Candidatus Frackibacter]SDC00107.1 4Fe-4S binding domain-containing protein [Candidatus Frackibacter sp. WG11]SEM31653.1 4Fe-4S binding domain-containing protein [Candidatus Frackibacter sp. WG12]SFL36578.1 4Fe-4S binding domain-containing protein [Candidatus Frackibacter sp. WG13]
MAKYVMVIDLHKCAGCGACVISCKNENNVQEGFYWGHYTHKTVGKFPNVSYEFIPTLCNHCDNAPCVEVCPVGAMHKDEDGTGLTLHDPDKCIGCKRCQKADPYGVINYNKTKAHPFWRDNEKIIPKVTSSGKEVAKAVGEIPPYYNPARANTTDRGKTYDGIRRKGVVEKCLLCDHRVKKGLEPYCATACPADARIIGDLDDKNSEVSRLLKKYNSFRLKENLGTKPRVYYIRDFNAKK